MAEMFLQHRSKENWIKLGDDNTNYFHSVIKQRRLKQATTQLKDENGVWQHDPATIANLFVKYYEEILGRRCETRRKAFDGFVQLSYAGRLQIINAVSFSIHNFWGAVFILPQSVLKQVDKICREYLWGTTNERKKISLVSWDKICCPKKVGGLNIKGCRNWNIASVGKLLWQLSEKKDSLWVRWVHGIYIKADGNIWAHKAPVDSI
ncbi:hypothetical protein MTR67_033799 [Solanum verrucosum]|uniref:Uncharacterized protein n=1 Tax=Solanum verrucosum TaxID=315347 RepID=A0AAF0ZKR0_SOLVR|nr:hypothetical protein MTR67_033799 [Solanum verrucosum]